MNLQEEIFVGSTDGVSVVYLVDLHRLLNRAHNEFSDNLQGELWRIELVNDWDRFTGNTLLHYLWYIRGCRRTVKGLSQGIMPKQVNFGHSMKHPEKKHKLKLDFKL